MRAVMRTVALGWLWLGLCLGAAFPAHAAALPTPLPAAMRAGTAKAVITPGDFVGRISVMGNPIEGKEHDLYARALVLNDGETRLVIVTYDLNCLDVATSILRVRCRDELDIDPACLILLGTHNHQAPIQIVPDNFDYGRRLADYIFGLIQEAIANEQGPVRLFFGTGEANFVFAMGSKVKDEEVQVLKVARADQTVALLFNHPTHPLQASSKNIGVGHCGYAVDDVERRVPGALALYADAAGGNQFPKKPKGIKDRLEAVRALGETLADAVLAIAQGPMQDVTGPIASKLEVISLPLAPPMPLDEAKALAEREEVPLDIGRVPYPHPHRETNWIRVLLGYYAQNKPFPKRTTDLVCTDDAFLLEELPESREFECRYEETIVARIGPLIFVAMQGEVCAPIGLDIKDAFRKDHPSGVTKAALPTPLPHAAPPIMLFAYMGEHNLYIPTRRIVERDLYQSRVLRIQYACPVGWDPNVGDEMADAVIRMVRASLEAK